MNPCIPISNKGRFRGPWIIASLIQNTDRCGGPWIPAIQLKIRTDLAVHGSLHSYLNFGPFWHIRTEVLRLWPEKLGKYLILPEFPFLITQNQA